MKTLKISNETNKEEIIKQINNFRLKNKNNWYQIELKYSNYTYKMKIYNTWIQIARVYENDKLLFNKSSCMDQKIKEFKQFLNSLIS